MKSINERAKIPGVRKPYASECPAIPNQGSIELKPGQKVVIEFEAVDKQVGLTSLAAIDFEDLIAGKSLSGVFKVNYLTFTK